MPLDAPYLKLRESQPFLRQVPQREIILKNILRILTHHEQDFMDALKKDLGRSPLESFLAEIYFTKKEISFVLKHLRAWARPKRTSIPFFHWPSQSSIVPKPKGVVLNISPWNYPLQISLAPTVSAIAAGNSVMIKPSEYAEHTSQLLAQLFNTPDFEGFLHVAPGGPDVADTLLNLKWDHIFFTGGNTIGQKVYERAAKNLTPVTLELGGNNPCVVDHDVPFEAAAEKILLGKCFNAGQTCVAPNVLLVPQETHDEWIKTLSRTLEKFYGPDAKQSPDFGRIIHEKHARQLQSLIPPHAITFGAPDVSSKFIPPTLIPNSSFKDACVQREIFGPILPVIPYASLSELDAHAHLFRESLACYVFSKHAAFVDQIEEMFKPATLGVNDVMKQATNLELPLGGRGPSGFGAYRGHHGFLTFSHLQAQSTRTLYTFDLFKTLPPYKNTFAQLKKWLG